MKLKYIINQMTTTPQTTQAHKPTPMQKLLGRNYKWWYIFLFGLKSNSAYIFSDIMWVIGKLVGILSIIYVWQLTGNYDTRNIIVLSNMFVALYGFQIVYSISEYIHSGRITSKLLVPTNYIQSLIFHGLGSGLRYNIFQFILFFLLALYFNISVNIVNLLIIILLSYPLGFIMFISIEVIVASITFWSKFGYGTNELYQNLCFILYGLLIPLNFLLNFFSYLPTSFFIHHPMQIYLGKYTPLETFYAFSGGIAWCIILYFLAKWVFKKGLKRNEAVGL